MSCEGVAEGTQWEDSWVEEASVRLDVESGEETRSLGVQIFEWWEGWVNVSERWVS